MSADKTSGFAFTVMARLRCPPAREADSHCSGSEVLGRIVIRLRPTLRPRSPETMCDRIYQSHPANRLRSQFELFSQIHVLAVIIGSVVNCPVYRQT